MGYRTEKQKLQTTFIQTLKSVWARWDEWDQTGTPFGNLKQFHDMFLSMFNNSKFVYDVGWCRGVSEAYGWPLTRPGPKDWIP